MGYKIGIDVGGTFTDFVTVGRGGEVFVTKVPSTPANQARGVMEGLEKIARRESLLLEGLLGETDLIVHGTTVATNTLLELNGAPTGLITTRGFRDDIELRRGFKERLFDPRYPPPHPIAPRRCRIGVGERLDARGEVVTPLDEVEARAAIRRLKALGVEAVAVCFLFSFLNPVHERRVAELLQEELPEAFVSLSHEVLPQVREFERVSTTLINAYTGPKLTRYLESLVAELQAHGFRRGEFFVMQSNGGIMHVEFVSRNAVGTLLSGPAGGVIGAAYLGDICGHRHFITVDMGGTSYDVCLIKDLQPVVNTDSWVSRYRVAVPMLNIHTIGAGGGSIAWVDPGGALHVGPQSAGADPGPICYGRGGQEPTVTDANLVLGYINPCNFLGGEMPLCPENVREAIRERVGNPLGMGVVEAALGIFRLVNHNMAAGIRAVSVQKGYDPRDFALLAFGGNGAVHAGVQARDLGMRLVIVPKLATAFSALGLLASDLRITKARSYLAGSDDYDLDRINSLYDAMIAEVRRELMEENAAQGRLVLKRSIDFHYPGQTHELTAPLLLGPGGRGEREPGGTGAGEREAVTDTDIDDCIRRFHQLHEQLHTFSNPDQRVELMTLRLEADVLLDKPVLPLLPAGGKDPAGALKERRPVYFEEHRDYHETPIYDGERVEAGNVLEGSCIVEEPATTLVVYPGQVATLNRHGSYEIRTS